MKFITVLSTCGNKKEAMKIAKTLVEERLVACANYFPVDSTYRWKGRVVKDKEYLLICKTKSSKFSQLEKRLSDIHSYATPEILTIPILRGKKEYLDWLNESTG